MSLFPGRTLEELDTIDINRLLRVLEAKRMESVEARRRLQMAGKLDAKGISPEDWALIAEMDTMEAANDSCTHLALT